MSALDDAIAKIQNDIGALTAAVDSSIANLTGLSGQIADLQAKLASAGVSQAQLDALAAISAGVESETTALSAASTPAAPAPAPAAPAAPVAPVAPDPAPAAPAPAAP